MTHEKLLAKLFTVCPSGCSIRNEHWHEPLDGYTNKYLNALRAVVELHRPGNSGCETCYIGFKCITIQAIEKALK